MAYKDDVLAAIKGAKRTPVAVNVAGIESPFYVRSMKGWERSQFESRNVGKDRDTVHYRADYLSVTLCDANGESLGLTPAEVLQLDDAETWVTEPIFEAALTINGMGGKATEEVKKN